MTINEVQTRADCSGTAADGSSDGEREDRAAGLQRSGDTHADLLPVAEGIRRVEPESKVTGTVEQQLRTWVQGSPIAHCQSPT